MFIEYQLCARLSPLLFKCLALYNPYNNSGAGIVSNPHCKGNKLRQRINLLAQNHITKCLSQDLNLKLLDSRVNSLKICAIYL